MWQSELAVSWKQRVDQDTGSLSSRMLIVDIVSEAQSAINTNF